MKPIGYMFSPGAPPVPVKAWRERDADMRPDRLLWLRNSWKDESEWLSSDYAPVLDADVPPEYMAFLLLLE